VDEIVVDEAFCKSRGVKAGSNKDDEGQGNTRPGHYCQPGLCLWGEGDA